MTVLPPGSLMVPRLLNPRFPTWAFQYICNTNARQPHGTGENVCTYLRLSRLAGKGKFQKNSERHAQFPTPNGDPQLTPGVSDTGLQQPHWLYRETVMYRLRNFW